MMRRSKVIDKTGPWSFTSFARDVGFDAINTLKYLTHYVRPNLSREIHFAKNSEHPPVILIQGFMGTTAMMGPLDRFLRERNRHVFLIDLGMVNIGDIADSAEKLVFEIERISDQYARSFGFQKFDIIAHSMGGLIALYYIKKLGGHRLTRKLIALGTPFRGTWAAVMGALAFGMFSRGVWQMLPGSAFLRHLHDDPMEFDRCKVYSIAAQADTLCPPRSCFLRGAVNRILPLGHASLVMDRRVFETITDFLDSKWADSNVIAFEHFRK